MSAAYILSVVNEVLARGWDVSVDVHPLDSDTTANVYRRGERSSYETFELGLGAMHGGTLRKICEELEIPFDEARVRIEGAGGLWGQGPY